ITGVSIWFVVWLSLFLQIMFVVVMSPLPSGWIYSVKSAEYTIKEVSVLPADRKSIILSVEVPLKVRKGNYPFKISAGDLSALPLAINVSEEGVFRTEFTSGQISMQGKAGATLTFPATLKNVTGEKQIYSLMADVPRGWNVTFKVNYQPAASVEINANSSADITIEVVSPSQSEAGTYRIPVRATTKDTSKDLVLEAVVSGYYGMSLTTPTGLLSTELTANEQKQIELLVQNTGSAELQNVELIAATPANWEVTFEPKKIDRIPAGQAYRAYAKVKAAKKAIAGDYVTNLEAKTPDVMATASFRVSVETPLLWGWVGVLVIIIAIGSIYYLFRTYGRR
ncbi:MAG TPA: NEW3 domain-containing protein, partial [Bacteroidales bacterium]|nr:NEW3 domain-containing protein [Bacteroidales bacterium]